MRKNRTLFVFIITLCLLLPAFLQAQVDTAWVRRYNGPGNGDDGAYAIAVDDSNNVYITGSSIGSSGIYRDCATIKYNSAGVQQWAARYNGPGNDDDYASAIAVDVQGNVYVAGTSLGSGTGMDYVTIKYNTIGETAWVRRYNGPGNASDNLASIAVDGQGNVYVTGASASLNALPYNYDYATVKYSSVGVQQWVARYNGPGNNEDDAYALTVDGQRNVYVTGLSTGAGTNSDYLTIKYDSTGDTVWVRRYDGPANDYDGANAIAADSLGNVYVTGGSGIYPNYDYATIKYNSVGVQQWVSRYNGPGNGLDQALSLVTDGQGNVFVTGVSQGSGTGTDYATIKYNATGDTLWVRRYNGPANSNDQAHSLAIDGQSNVYVTGNCTSSGSGHDYATIKYNSAGVQ